ncbi:MAG: hypothetical protein OXH99_21245 [Bryobacterales bacterium]|nr:hypothetical protein [Bryobacterales bacterium]
MPTFDTLAAARDLQDAGIDSGHAEAIVDAVPSVISEQVATKADLRELEQRLLIRLGAPLFAGLGLLFAALKLTA